MKLRDRSLKFKLMSLTGGIVVGLVVCFLAMTRYFVGQEESKVLDKAEAAASEIGAAIGAQFYERYGDAQAFAMNPDLRSPSPQVVADALNSYASLYGIYDLILVADDHGKIVGVNTKSPSGKDINAQALYGRDVSDAPWYRNTMSGSFTADESKALTGTYFEDVHMDALVAEIYGVASPGTSFSAQLKDKSGKVIGVVSNRAGSRWFEGALEAGYEKLTTFGYRRGDVIVHDKKGLVLAEASVKRVGEKVAVLRDPSSLLKKNLIEENSPAARQVIETGRPGNLWGFNKAANYATAAGFAPVSGKKFVDAIGWNVLVRGPKDEVLAGLAQLKWMIFIALAVMMVLVLTVSTLFSNSLSNQLRKIAQSVSGGTDEIDGMATHMAEASGQLSSATTEQAAALQETVSSIDEVSSMIAKNADNAKRSQETSVVSSDAARKGKEVVGEMIESIGVINRSNADIMRQIEAGNQQLGEIVQVIQEIGDKTKVINDIVFQTKLLSFNASVEAARAGEHGKGFAVVAEEVGNLAQMSGSAAKEISAMLDGSIQKVQQIVDETRSRVDQLMKDSQSKVEAGTVTAKRCGEVLDEIVKNVAEVAAMVSEIATASKEQSQGVTEINQAMNQLDQVTQQNAAAAQQAATVAEKLRGQGRNMQQLAGELLATVEGKGDAAKAPPAASAPVNPAPAPAAGESAKVLAFSKAAPAKPEATKLAAGAGVAPSRDDSRFEEV